MTEPLKDMEDHLSHLAGQLMALPKWVDDDDPAEVDGVAPGERTILRVSDDKYPASFELMKEFDNAFYGVVEAKEKQQLEEQRKKDEETSVKDLDHQIQKLSSELKLLLDRMRLTARAYWRLRRRIKLKNAKYGKNGFNPNRKIPFFIKEDPELKEINNVTDPLFFHRAMQDQVAFARERYSRMEELVAVRYKDCDLDDITAGDDDSTSRQMNRDLDMISEMSKRVEDMCKACLLTVHQIEMDGEGPPDYMAELLTVANGQEQKEEEESDASSSVLSDTPGDLNAHIDDTSPQGATPRGYDNNAKKVATMKMKELSPEELHKQEEERLEQEIQEMTAQLKASTMAMHSTLRDQTKGLDEIHDAVTQNLDSVSNVTDTVTERNRRGWRKQAATWTLFFSCLATFIVLFFTMRIVPKRQNACLFFGCSSRKTESRENTHHYHRYHYEEAEHDNTYRSRHQENEGKTREKVQPKCSDGNGRPMQCGSSWRDDDEDYISNPNDDDDGEDAAMRLAKERRLERLASRLAKASNDIHADSNAFRRAAEKTAERVKQEKMVGSDSRAPTDDYYDSDDDEVDEDEMESEQEEEEGEEGEAETLWKGDDDDLTGETTPDYESEEDLSDDNTQDEFGFDAMGEEVSQDDDLWDHTTENQYGGGRSAEGRSHVPEMTQEEVTRLESDLRVAARDGNVPLMKSLLERRPNAVHAVDHNGWAALHEASRAGETLAVEFLVLEYGANVNHRSNFGYGGTPLHFSISFNGENHPTSLFLKSRGAEVVKPQ